MQDSPSPLLAPTVPDAPFSLLGDGLGTQPALLHALVAMGVAAALICLWLWRAERNRSRGLAAELAQTAQQVETLQETLETAQDGYHLWIRPTMDPSGASASDDPLEDALAEDPGPDGAEDSREGLASETEAWTELCSRRLAVLLRLPSGREASFLEIAAGFADEDRAKLVSAVEALRSEGEPFSLDLSRRGIGRRIHARGLRIGGWDGQPLADALWMRDVTEDREALEQLAEEADALTSERDGLRALIDALPVGVWMRDEALALADCNQAHLRALDLPDREAALSQPREIAEGVTGQEMRALAARSRAAGTGSAGRFHVLIGGERRLLEVTETPTAPGGSKPGHTVGLAYDITMIEDLETRLTRDAAAQAEVLERLGTAIAVFGSDTRLSFHNTAFAKLWSLDTDWLAQSPGYGAFLERLREGRRLPEVADFPAFKAGELKQFAKLLQPKEDILHLPDGTTLRRVIAPHPLGGLLTTFEDVTDSLALERSFNQLTAVQRETLDHLKEAVAVFGPDGTLQLCNPPFTALWGLSPDGSTSPTEAGTNADADGGPSTGAGAGAALSATMAQLTELAARVEQSEADAARAGLGGPSGHFRRRLLAPPDSRETRSGRLTRSDGTHLDYTGVPLPDGGLLISFLDVTDRVRVETALRERTDALRAAELLKGEFISHVSFELRTPLTTIAGFAEILAEGYYGALNPRQSDYAKVIAETAEQVTRLLDDIGDLVSVEAGQLSLELDAFDIHAALAAVLSLTRETAKRRNVTVHFDCPPDAGWMVADERRIKQILFHLMSNAVKFTEAGGQVTLAADRKDGFVSFTVADTGRGMEVGTQEKAFGGFIKDPSSEGVGLGLTLVRQFVDLHGGRMELLSVPGEGTTVIVEIPSGG